MADALLGEGTAQTEKMSAATSLPEASAILREEKRFPALVRAVFSFPVVLGAMLVLLMTFSTRTRFSDPDLWWHLKVGEVIWNTHSIPRFDSFSFTAAGHAWTAQEWLSELAMFGAWKLGGYVGLMAGFAIIASLLIVAAYALCTLYSGNCKVAFLGGVSVWLFSTIGLAIRPHMLGYLLLVCELLIVHLGRTRSRLWLMGLPPLFALWINLHSSFAFGLVVLCVVLCFSFVEFRLGSLVSDAWPRDKRTMLAVAFALSTVALFVNPIGLKLLWYPVDVMLNQPVNVGIVEEWQQIDISDPRGVALLTLAGLVLLVPLMRRIDLSASELCVVALGFLFAIRHERMLFVFGILTAPVLCRLFATAWDAYDRQRDSAVASGIMLAITTGLVALSIPGSQNLDQQVEKANPAKAVQFLRNSGLTGRLLNEYVFGGYLIWAAPERKVFIDGRADLHESAGVLQEYASWISVQTDPRKFLEKYAIRICLLARNAPLAHVMALLPGWKQVYSDDLAVVFARGE